MKVRLALMALSMALLSAASVGAQDFRGRINGTVTDNTGAVLPGVTVTATSPALDPAAGAGDRRGWSVPVHRAAARPLRHRLRARRLPEREARRRPRRHQPDADRRPAAERRHPAGDGDRHRRVTGRRHLDDAGGHELHEGTAHRDPERARHLGGHGAGARHPDDELRRRRLAHRHADRLPHLRLRRPEPDQARGHRHHRGHRRQRRLLRLRQLRGVPGRRRRQRRRQLRRRHQHEHHGEVGRRPLHRQLVQRLGRRRHHQRQRAGQRSRSANQTRRGRLLLQHARSPAATRSTASTTSTPTSAARCGSRRRGSSTATA